MEILPGVGVEAVRLGDLRSDVEQRLGPPAHPDEARRAVYTSTEPMLVVTYDQADVVEIVETGYSGSGGEEVFFDGVQLTYRFMDQVVADLTAKGHASTAFDIGFAFEPGFAVFSNSSLWALDLDPDASEDDERRIVEGVAVGPYSYFAYSPPANATLDELEAWLREQGVLPPE